MVVLFRLPHVEIAPHLEALVERALEVAGNRDLAYPRPSGDWLDPKPRPKIMSHVRAVAKATSNATMSLSSLDDADSFALEYRAYLPVWIAGRAKGRPGLPEPRRGKASHMSVTFPRELLYERTDAMVGWMASLLGLVPFSAATLGLSLEGHYADQYRLGLEHLALDISDVGCVTDDVGDDLHGVAWLTALGPKLVERLGGRAALARDLGSVAEVGEAAGGALVRLGPHPVRGTTEPELAPYRAVAHRLGPALHVPRETSYFTCAFDDGSGKYADRDHAMQEAWHRRLVMSRGELARVFRP